MRRTSGSGLRPVGEALLAFGRVRWGLLWCQVSVATDRVGVSCEVPKGARSRNALLGARRGGRKRGWGVRKLTVCVWVCVSVSFSVSLSVCVSVCVSFVCQFSVSVFIFSPKNCFDLSDFFSTSWWRVRVRVRVGCAGLGLVLGLGLGFVLGLGPSCS